MKNEILNKFTEVTQRGLKVTLWWEFSVMSNFFKVEVDSNDNYFSEEIAIHCEELFHEYCEITDDLLVDEDTFWEGLAKFNPLTNSIEGKNTVVKCTNDDFSVEEIQIKIPKSFIFKSVCFKLFYNVHTKRSYVRIEKNEKPLVKIDEELRLISRKFESAVNSFLKGGSPKECNLIHFNMIVYRENMFERDGYLYTSVSNVDYSYKRVGEFEVNIPLM